MGAGKIGREYLKILTGKRKFEVKAILATSEKNYDEVKKITKKRIFTTDTKILSDNFFDLAIIAVPVDKTYQITTNIMKFVKNLLIEKPPSLNFKDAKTLSKKSKINKNNFALNQIF